MCIQHTIDNSEKRRNHLNAPQKEIDSIFGDIIHFYAANKIMMQIYIYRQNMLFATLCSEGGDQITKKHMSVRFHLCKIICIRLKMCRRIFTTLRVSVGLLSHKHIGKRLPETNVGSDCMANAHGKGSSFHWVPFPHLKQKMSNVICFNCIFLI